MKKTLSSLVVAFLLVAGPAAAETAEEQATRLSKQIMSPFCPGLTLHDCPSDASVDLRNRIEGWARDGDSDQQIFDRLEELYGPGLRAFPEDGDGVLIFVVPGAVLVAGFVVAWLVARRWSRQGPEGTAEASPSAEDHRRAEAEIGAFRDQWMGKR